MNTLTMNACEGGGIEICLDGIPILRHVPGSFPLLSAGKGQGSFEMYRGNFRVSEEPPELEALDSWRSAEDATKSASPHADIVFSSRNYEIKAHILRGRDGRLRLRLSVLKGAPNRLRINLPASPDEHIYGCGEQFSYFDLRGRNFPLWSSEQGVGRNKDTAITKLADADGGSGGDYYWTFYPQTSFASSAHYWCYLATSAYSEFDFRQPDRHILYSWDIPRSLVISRLSSMRAVEGDIAQFFGRQKALPSWCYGGIVLGIQGGTKVCLDKLAAARAAGAKVAGIWAQDWEGIHMTSFGQRLRWNWVWDAERYPELETVIRDLKSEGIRFLGYINPYVGADMSLFNEAAEHGYLALNAEGSIYRVDFGEFDAGIVDLTNPKAFSWYKYVIKKNLIAFGLSGWMADFGEYLPTDAVLHSGQSAELAHNEWPVLWARCNREAVEEAEAEGLVPRGEIVFFMRAGGAGSGRYCPLMWAGDQNVDWSADDGLPSVIPAALSLALSGHGLHHSDLGGYTTLYGMKRSKELLLRWAEFSVFTVFMRSHEGNRPKDNWQFDTDRETLAAIAAASRLHAALSPYIESLARGNAENGIPLMMPLFTNYEDDAASWTIKDEYLLGSDLLVAPVLKEGALSRSVHLPNDSWICFWTGKHYGGGDFDVAAPLGMPPVFIRADSSWLPLFRKAAAAAGAQAAEAPLRP